MIKTLALLIMRDQKNRYNDKVLQLKYDDIFEPKIMFLYWFV